MALATRSSLRIATLRQSLNTRRLELTRDVRQQILERRDARPASTGDFVEASDAIIEEDLRLSLLEMRSETLTHIDLAIARLDAGNYGSCSECGDEIADERLRALPFALRCRACQEKRERVPARAIRMLAP